MEETEFSLQLSEDGKLTVRCDKAVRTLKSAPAKLKKNEYVAALHSLRYAGNQIQVKKKPNSNDRVTIHSRNAHLLRIYGSINYLCYWILPIAKRF